MESKQLKEILEQDKLWVESKEKEGRQAYLHGADLSDADLENAKQAQIVLRDREYKETLKEKDEEDRPQ